MKINQYLQYADISSLYARRYNRQV